MTCSRSSMEIKVIIPDANAVEESDPVDEKMAKGERLFKESKQKTRIKPRPISAPARCYGHKPGRPKGFHHVSIPEVSNYDIDREYECIMEKAFVAYKQYVNNGRIKKQCVPSKVVIKNEGSLHLYNQEMFRISDSVPHKKGGETHAPHNVVNQQLTRLSKVCIERHKSGRIMERVPMSLVYQQFRSPNSIPVPHGDPSKKDRTRRNLLYCMPRPWTASTAQYDAIKMVRDANKSQSTKKSVLNVKTLQLDASVKEPFIVYGMYNKNNQFLRKEARFLPSQCSLIEPVPTRRVEITHRPSVSTQTAANTPRAPPTDTAENTPRSTIHTVNLNDPWINKNFAGRWCHGIPFRQSASNPVAQIRNSIQRAALNTSANACITSANACLTDLGVTSKERATYFLKHPDWAATSIRIQKLSLSDRYSTKDGPKDSTKDSSVKGSSPDKLRRCSSAPCKRPSEAGSTSSLVSSRDT